MRGRKNKNFTCVILCAGRGTRIAPCSNEIPKIMLKIKGKPILDYVINYWKNYTDDFIFVVGYKKDLVIDYVSSLNIKSRFIEQKEQRGIADAVLCVKNYVDKNFLIVLGDCIFNGKFNFTDDFDQKLGVCKTSDKDFIRNNYSVEINKGCICNVIEKPKDIVNDFCGMGVYFLNSKVFNYISKTKPSSLRNEVEITDTIQNMIDAGEKIKPIFFEGDYLNITYPSDLKNAEKIISSLEKIYNFL